MTDSTNIEVIKPEEEDAPEFDYSAGIPCGHISINPKWRGIDNDVSSYTGPLHRFSVVALELLEEKHGIINAEVYGYLKSDAIFKDINDETRLGLEKASSDLDTFMEEKIHSLRVTAEEYTSTTLIQEDEVDELIESIANTVAEAVNECTTLLAAWNKVLPKDPDETSIVYH